MPKSITFEIPGKPLAKQRARLAKTTGIIYTPTQTVDYENFIRYIYLHVKNRLWFKKYVWVGFTAYFKIPKSVSKKQKQLMLDGVIQHDKKPDIDNILKILMDGLTGAAFSDDKCVTRIMQSEKLYTEKEEKIIVTLTYNSDGVELIK